MSAPKDRPEIQRYEAHAIRMMNGVHYASLRRHDDGKSVLYSDHLRHLKLAQIEVLEEMLRKTEQQKQDDSWLGTLALMASTIAALKEELAK